MYKILLLFLIISNIIFGSLITNKKDLADEELVYQYFDFKLGSNLESNRFMMESVLSYSDFGNIYTGLGFSFAENRVEIEGTKINRLDAGLYGVMGVELFITKDISFYGFAQYGRMRDLKDNKISISVNNGVGNVEIYFFDENKSVRYELGAGLRYKNYGIEISYESLNYSLYTENKEFEKDEDRLILGISYRF